MKHLPEQEQLNALAKFEDEYASLSEPEQFGVVVSTLLLSAAAQWCVRSVSALRLGRLTAPSLLHHVTISGTQSNSDSGPLVSVTDAH